MGFQNYSTLPRHLRGMLGLSPEVDPDTYSQQSRTQVCCTWAAYFNLYSGEGSCFHICCKLQCRLIKSDRPLTWITHIVVCHGIDGNTRCIVKFDDIHCQNVQSVLFDNSTWHQWHSVGGWGNGVLQARVWQTPVDAQTYSVPQGSRGLQSCMHILCNPRLQVCHFNRSYHIGCFTPLHSYRF